MDRWKKDSVLIPKCATKRVVGIIRSYMKYLKENTEEHGLFKTEIDINQKGAP